MHYEKRVLGLLIVLKFIGQLLFSIIRYLKPLDHLQSSNSCRYRFIYSWKCLKFRPGDLDK